jgi:thioredoxin-related protein
MQRRTNILSLLLVVLLFSPGCTSSESIDSTERIPSFSITGDDQITYSSENLLGTSYILHFSASCCNNCRSTIHAIDNHLTEKTYLIVSTDASDSDKLSDWHQQVNESKEGSTVNASFSVNVKLAQILDIKNTPTLILVGKDGRIIDRHLGPLTEESEIDAFWNQAD